MFENKKRVYRFGGKTAEGDGSMRELLGGKGANLAEMSKLGMPVPAAVPQHPVRRHRPDLTVNDKLPPENLFALGHHYAFYRQRQR